MFFFLARKHHHIAKWKTARKKIKEDSDYLRRGHNSIIIVWQFQWRYVDLLKILKFPCKKRLHNKRHINLATEALKSFCPDVFNRLCVTHNKSSNNWNLEPKSELITSLLFKKALKLWLSSQAVDGKYSVFQVLSSSESYRNVSS